MTIDRKTITVRDLVNGYDNDVDRGVHGYGGKLDIRPPYQREFRYDLKQKQAVVNTILKGFPLNIMYWSVVNENEFEMIDGQGLFLFVNSITMISILRTKTAVSCTFSR